MGKIGLALLFLLHFAANTQGSTFSGYTGFVTTSNTPTTMLTTTSLSSSSNMVPTCSVNEVPNYQNLCIKPIYIEGCQVYKTSNTCYTCSKGYKLNSAEKCNYNTMATTTITHIKGCIKQSSATQCQICAEGFYKNGTKCTVGIAHCAKYNSDGTCNQCEADYSMILSRCRHNNLLGCKYETAQHTCTQCYSPFQLSNGYCDIDNCKILNDYGCTSCQCGFYLTADRTCQPIQPGCLRYQNGVCKDCLAHYKLKGGICEIQGCQQYDGSYCSQCSSKYDLVEGQCKFKNCFDWLNDQCVACEKGYVLKNGTCEQSNSAPCG